MPHPGTHIAVMQALATSTDPADKAIAALFGNGEVNATGSNTKNVSRNRYACLGALGPDLFYFLMDGAEEDVAIQDIVIRYYAAVHSVLDIADSADVAMGKIEALTVSLPCVGDFVETVSAQFHELSQTLQLALGVIGNLIADAALASTGFNAFKYLPSPRQAGKGRKKWYWADYLHYVRAGEFTGKLMDLALFDPKYKDTPELAAYAGGYFTHYVADTIGHPYVNQIVGGPYRLHRQRHTLVENFMDAVVWNGMFVGGPLKGEKKNPATNDPWLDRFRTAATPKDAPRAEFHRSRVNLMFEVAGPKGVSGLDPAIDKWLKGISNKTASDIDGILDTKPLQFMSEATFKLWSEMMIDALKKTYGGNIHPQGLGGDGFPTSEHINLAYVTASALMKMATGSSIEYPAFPDVSGFEKEVKEFLDKVTDAVDNLLDELTSSPKSSSGSSFSWKSIWNSIRDWAKKVVAAAVAVVAAVAAAIGAMLELLCGLAGKAVTAVVQVANWVNRVALWAAYDALHQMLELRAYAQPTAKRAHAHPYLWTSPGNPGSAVSMTGQEHAYPIMELLDEEGRIAQDQKWSGLEPISHPLGTAPVRKENPTLLDVGVCVPDTLNPLMDLLNGVGGPGPDNDMFSPKLPPSENSADGFRRDFGGIIPNCRRGLSKMLENAAQAGATTCVGNGLTLPDYNLDGDRGGAWLSWDLSPESTALRPPNNAETQIKAVSWKD